MAAEPGRRLRALRQRRQRLRRRLHRRPRRPRRRGDRQRGRHLVAQVGAAGRAATPTATKIFAYLTIPEDAKIGVCAHELGHLFFGWPDLYDTDGTSEGIGNWCLMAGGSWSGGGDVPAHPSAWCKANQGWVDRDQRDDNGTVDDRRRQDEPRRCYRLWKDGGGGNEYFLVENRQQDRLRRVAARRAACSIWHIDEASRRQHRREPLQGRADAGGRAARPRARQNRGDAGDPYPGTSANTELERIEHSEQQLPRRAANERRHPRHPAIGPTISVDFDVTAGDRDGPGAAARVSRTGRRPAAAGARRSRIRSRAGRRHLRSEDGRGGPRIPTVASPRGGRHRRPADVAALHADGQ